MSLKLKNEIEVELGLLNKQIDVFRQLVAQSAQTVPNLIEISSLASMRSTLELKIYLRGSQLNSINLELQVMHGTVCFLK